MNQGYLPHRSLYEATAQWPGPFMPSLRIQNIQFLCLKHDEEITVRHAYFDTVSLSGILLRGSD